MKTPNQLLEEIAELLYCGDEIDAWGIYDDLDSLFDKYLPELKKKFSNQTELKELINQKEFLIIQAKLNLENLQNDLEKLKSELL